MKALPIGESRKGMGTRKIRNRQSAIGNNGMDSIIKDNV